MQQFKVKHLEKEAMARCNGIPRISAWGVEGMVCDNWVSPGVWGGGCAPPQKIFSIFG